MNALTIAAIAAAVLFLALVAYVKTRPATFRVIRSAQVDAPPEVVFPLINDFHNWKYWSPYEKLDPNMKKTLEGSAEGPGAIYSWSGNAKAGQGRMTILDSKPSRFVNISIEFTKPFRCANKVFFEIEPAGAACRVSWIMEGKNNVLAKVAGLFMNMDKMMGESFSEGLASLNQKAQATP